MSDTRRLFVWDFDGTLVNCAGPGVISQFYSPVFFARTVMALLSQGHCVAIASFNRYEVVQAYMDLLFSQFGQMSPFWRFNIYTPDAVRPENPVLPPVTRKNDMLFKLASRCGNFALENIYLFDDSAENVQQARSAGFRAVLCNGGFSKSCWDEAVRMARPCLFQ